MMSEYYECHCHVALDGEDFRAAAERHKSGIDDTYICSILRKYMNSGISYVRDGGDKWGVSRHAAAIAEQYGIEYVTPLFPIFKKGNYGGFIGRPYETFSDFYKLVKEVKTEGGNFIKLMASGIMDFENPGSLTGFGITDDINEIIKICHGEGMPVMVHVNGSDNVKAAVCAGADSIEHGNFIDDKAIEDIASSGCLWVPTVAATACLIGKGLFPEQSLKKILKMQLDNIESAAKKGANIALGSDAGAKSVMHTTGLVKEAELLRPLISENRILNAQEKLRSIFTKR